MAHDHTHGITPDMNSEHQKRLMASLALTAMVFLAEVVSSAITGSLALLVDAGHMLTDMSVLVASTATAILAQRRPSNRRTWGWARLEALTAAAGSLVLLFVGIYALFEAVVRLFVSSVDEVSDVRLLLVMGVIGLVANVCSIVILASRSDDNMNMKAAFLEVVNDALGSVAVVISAVVLMVTGWSGFDAIAGGVIALMMIPRAVALMRNAVRVLLEETPEGLNLKEVRKHLEQVPHVVAVHDLHASTISTDLPILMAHIVVEQGLSMEQGAAILSQLQECLIEDFPVSVPHTTFQLEPEGYSSASQERMHR